MTPPTIVPRQPGGPVRKIRRAAWAAGPRRPGREPTGRRAWGIAIDGKRQYRHSLYSQ